MSSNLAELIVKIKANTTEFVAATQKMTQEFDKVGKKWSQVSDGMVKTGKSMSKSVTLPIVALGAAVVAVGSGFEAEMSKVQGIVGATGEEMVILKDKAKEMGATTQFSAAQSAEAFKYMGMAGWDASQSVAAIGGVMDLAAASGENLGTVADIVTDSMTAFKLESDQAGKFADLLASASSNANTNVGMLGESFKYVAPLAGAMGYNVEEVTKYLAVMANNGIKASQAGTTMRTALTNLAKPTDEAAMLMERLGVSVANSDGTMKSMDELMGDLRGSFSSLNEEQQAQAATTLFGKQSMAGMLAIMNTSEKDLAKLTNATTNYAGAAKKMADTNMDNVQGSMIELKSALEGVAISFYEQIAPALQGFIDQLKVVVTWFGNLSPETKNMIVKVLGFIAVIGPLLVIGGKMIAMIQTAVKVFQVFKTVMIMVNVVLAANPIILIVAAVALLIVGIVLLIKNWDAVKDKFREVWNNIMVKVDDIKFKIWLFLENLKLKWIEIWDKIKAFAKAWWDTFLDVMKTMFRLLLAVFTGGLSEIALFIYKNWDEIKEKTIAVWTSVKEWFATMWTAIKDKATEIWDSLKVWFATFWETLKESFAVALRGILAVITFGMSEVGIFVAKNWDEIKEKTIAVWESVKEYIAELWASIVETATNIFSTIKTKVLEIWESIKTSVSAAITNVITFVTELIDKLNTLFWDLVEKVKTIFTNMVKAIQEKFDDVKTAVLKVITDIKTKIIEKIGDFIQIGKDLLAGLIKGLVDGAVGIWEKVKMIGTNIIQGFKDIFGIHSPSSVLRDIFMQLGKGGTLGLVESFKETIKAVKNITGTITEEFKTSTVAIGKMIKEVRAAPAEYNRSVAKLEKTKAITDFSIGQGIKNVGTEYAGKISLDAGISNEKTIKNLTEAMTSMGDTFSKIKLGDEMKEAVNEIGSKIEASTDGFITKKERSDAGFIEDYSEAQQDAVGELSKLTKSLQSFVSLMMSKMGLIAKKFEDLVENIEDIFNSTIKKLEETLSAFLTSLEALLFTFLNSFADVLEEFLYYFVQSMKNIFRDMNEWLEKIYYMLLEIKGELNTQTGILLQILAAVSSGGGGGGSKDDDNGGGGGSTDMSKFTSLGRGFQPGDTYAGWAKNTLPVITPGDPRYDSGNVGVKSVKYVQNEYNTYKTQDDPFIRNGDLAILGYKG